MGRKVKGRLVYEFGGLAWHGAYLVERTLDGGHYNIAKDAEALAKAIPWKDKSFNGMHIIKEWMACIEGEWRTFREWDTCKVGTCPCCDAIIITRGKGSPAHRVLNTE